MQIKFPPQQEQCSDDSYCVTYYPMEDCVTHHPSPAVGPSSNGFQHTQQRIPPTMDFPQQWIPPAVDPSQQGVPPAMDSNTPSTQQTQ